MSLLKMRVALLGITALLIASGAMASVASASPFWHAGGSKLTGTRSVSLQVKGSAVLGSTALGIEIECKKSASEGATIENSATQGLGTGKVTYSSCTVRKPEKECVVAEPITTNPTKSYLAEEKGEGQKNFLQVFEPTTGKVFVELKLHR